MKILPLLATLSIGAMSAAQAMTLTFDDLSGSGALPSNYGGLTWDSGFTYYSTPQSPYNASSGATRVYWTTSPAAVSFGSDVELDSLWLAGYKFGLYLEGYNDGVKLFESVHFDGGGQFGTLLNLDWTGIDELRFVGDASFAIVDDLTFTRTAASVPEGGSSLFLLALGCIAIGGAASVTPRRSS